MKFIKNVWIIFVACGLLFGSATVFAQEISDTSLAKQKKQIEEVEVNLFVFGREGCGFCEKEKEYLESDEFTLVSKDVNYIYYDIFEDDIARGLYNNITESNEIAKITPLTLVGGSIIQGFNSPDTTGEEILKALESARAGNDYDVEEYIDIGEIIKSGLGCEDNPEAIVCDIGESNYEFNLPFFGIVNFQDFSLFSLSFVLGLVDGFNPCAMWVLVTFLLVLMQIGDRRKMFYVAGLFMFAEATMYYMILNVWYKTFDFIGYDQIITPLIGFLATGSGVYFLYKYQKSKDVLTCDVTSLEYQSGIEKKITKLIHSPMTIVSAFGIIGIAFSVNIVEFACSIGIPQAFTKILDMNYLDFVTRQWYLLTYVFGYMIDDFVVFGFALWGIDKINSSYKYSKLSMLIGGILMIILGAIMLIAPDILMF